MDLSINVAVAIVKQWLKYPAEMPLVIAGTIETTAANGM
jgi:hypothetical protein